MEAERTQEESVSLLTSLPARPVRDSTFLLLLRGPEAGAVRPHSVLFLCWLGAAGGRAEALGSVPQGESQEVHSPRVMRHGLLSPPPRRARGALPFSWAPLPSQTQPGLQHTVNVCTRSLSVTPGRGPQKTVRRNEGGLVGRSVCCPVQGETAALGPRACPPKGSNQLHY